MDYIQWQFDAARRGNEMKPLGKRLVVGAACLVVVFVLIVVVALDLSRTRVPDGIAGLIAAHWQAGQPVDCRLCPEHLFVVVCDADRQVHLRSLRQLARFQEEFRKHGGEWSRQMDGAYSCIENRSFSMARPFGAFGGPYDPDDPGFRQDVAFRVLSENAGSQVVEVRYKDSRTDIDDALFRYETNNGSIRPLESWVITRGHFTALVIGAIAFVFSVLLGGILYVWVAALWRRIRSRQRKA